MLRKLVTISLLSLPSAPLLTIECSADIQSNDQMQFNTNAIIIDKNCKQFTVSLFRPSNLPKGAMSHSQVLNTAASMQGAVIDGMASDLDESYLEPDDGRVIAHTKLISSSKRNSMAFGVSKLKEGEQYTFFCTFPGHSALMKGILTLR